MDLIETLRIYQPFDNNEAAMVQKLNEFLKANGKTVFGRELTGVCPNCGHVTGSSWIVNATGTRAVLVFHAKLRRWVQAGGHSENGETILQTATREAREETGLDVRVLDLNIFDIDAHRIPEYWNTPEHWHFDVRYLFEANNTFAPICSQESRDVRWIELEEIERKIDSQSLWRMIAKTRQRFNLLANPKLAQKS